MAKIEIELTALQARVIRRAFLPANPNKLRPRSVQQADGSYSDERFDGKSLKELAHEMIAALDAAAA